MIHRRGLLGMFAAGVGAAILQSGIIMPVRRILTAQPPDIHELWVDANARGDGSGSDLANAVNNLQAAVLLACSRSRIYIAENHTERGALEFQAGVNPCIVVLGTYRWKG